MPPLPPPSSRGPSAVCAFPCATLCAALALAALAGCAAGPSPRPDTPAAARTGSPTAGVPVGAPAGSPSPTESADETTTATAQPAPSGRTADETRLAFTRWVQDFAATAHQAGITDATLEAAFADVRLLQRVIDLDRRQPEFTQTVWDYLDRAVSDQRVARGREKLAQFQAEAEAAAARHGVPAEVLVAIWGMESSYGANFGDIPVIDALATLGFDGRRAAWARGQLLAALKILQSGDIDRARMVGSWAGAMGQTQFLPSNFLAYAVDADGDGRRDIWGSLADVLASTAHLLARAGWQPGQAWGAEVVLPPGFDPGRADASVRQSSAAWAAEGLQPPPGGTLPDLAQAEVLLPAGVRGPAFLVGPNFRAILRYNNATSYALAVGLLAQRLAGGAGVMAPWPRDQTPLSRSQLLALQTALNARGFAAGPPDGMMGPATREGIRNYQRSLGLPADGYPALELLRQLQTP